MNYTVGRGLNGFAFSFDFSRRLVIEINIISLPERHETATSTFDFYNKYPNGSPSTTL
jgi:hypothetical protein